MTTGVGGLSEREKQVLALIVRDRTNPEIAAELGIRFETAKWHVSEIITKLGVESREEAAQAWRADRTIGHRVARGIQAAVAPIIAHKLVIAAAASFVVAVAASGAIVGVLRSGHPSTSVPANEAPSLQGEFRSVDSPISFFAAAAAPLPAGHVLITGGRGSADDNPVSAAFILDMRTLTIRPTKSAMSTARAYHTATALPDGRILIVGDGSAELFDPHLEAFSPIAAPTLSHRGQASALLGDGSVLIAGGVDKTDLITAAAERFDPKTQVFRPVGAMSEPKVNATALSLATGDVVVVGGHTIETFSVTAGAFLQPIQIQGAVDPAAVLLPGGQVLLVGGLDGAAASQPRKGDTGIPASQDITLFDPATSTFHRVGQLNTPRYEAGAVLIDDHRVLVTGGMRDSHQDAGLIDSAETIDIVTWASSTVGQMHEARFYHLSVLSGGRIAVIGSPTRNARTSVEVFTP